MSEIKRTDTRSIDYIVDNLVKNIDNMNIRNVSSKTKNIAGDNKNEFPYITSNQITLGDILKKDSE